MSDVGEACPTCRETKMTFHPLSDQERGERVSEVVESELRLVGALEPSTAHGGLETASGEVAPRALMAPDRSKTVPNLPKAGTGLISTLHDPPISSAFTSGACRDRTGDLRLAKPALSQLS